MRTQTLNKLLGLPGIILLILILGWIEWKTGYEFHFFVFYFIPVIITAWFFGTESAIIISVLCALAWATSDYLSGHTYSSNLLFVWNTMICLVAYLIIGWAFSKIKNLYQAEKEKSDLLQKALSEIKTLEAFLSICCVCKKIHNKDGEWQQMESYISNNSQTNFSHGYCPECAKKAMEECGLQGTVSALLKNKDAPSA